MRADLQPKVLPENIMRHHVACPTSLSGRIDPATIHG
jgi:hypothetical protein